MQLDALLEQTLTGMGYELVMWDMSQGGLMRVFMDRPSGITIDDCVAVSNQLTRLFAVEGVSYDRLEISSPGLDRPLTKPEHFQRFAGQVAKIKMRELIGRRKQFVGTILDTDGVSVRLDCEGEVVSLALDLIDRAKLVPQF